MTVMFLQPKAGTVMASAAVATVLVGCAPPRQPVDLDIHVGSTSGRRCVVVYELQQRAPLGMATFWPVHLGEAGARDPLQVSRALCPKLMIQAVGEYGELVEHRGGRKAVLLDGAAIEAGCDAPELRESLSMLEEQLRDSDPAKCAG